MSNWEHIAHRDVREENCDPADFVRHDVAEVIDALPGVERESKMLHELDGVEHVLRRRDAAVRLVIWRVPATGAVRVLVGTAGTGAAQLWEDIRDGVAEDPPCQRS